MDERNDAVDPKTNALKGNKTFNRKSTNTKTLACVSDRIVRKKKNGNACLLKCWPANF